MYVCMYVCVCVCVCHITASWWDVFWAPTPHSPFVYSLSMPLLFACNFFTHFFLLKKFNWTQRFHGGMDEKIWPQATRRQAHGICCDTLSLSIWRLIWRLIWPIMFFLENTHIPKSVFPPEISTFPLPTYTTHTESERRTRLNGQAQTSDYFPCIWGQGARARIAEHVGG